MLDQMIGDLYRNAPACVGRPWRRRVVLSEARYNNTGVPDGGEVSDRETDQVRQCSEREPRCGVERLGRRLGAVGTGEHDAPMMKRVVATPGCRQDGFVFAVHSWFRFRPPLL